MSGLPLLFSENNFSQSFERIPQLLLISVFSQNVLKEFLSFYYELLAWYYLCHKYKQLDIDIYSLRGETLVTNFCKKLLFERW